MYTDFVNVPIQRSELEKIYGTSKEITLIKTDDYNKLIEEYTKLKNEFNEDARKQKQSNRDKKINELIHELKENGLLIHMINPKYIANVLRKFFDKYSIEL